MHGRQGPAKQGAGPGIPRFDERVLGPRRRGAHVSWDDLRAGARVRAGIEARIGHVLAGVFGTVAAAQLDGALRAGGEHRAVEVDLVVNRRGFQRGQQPFAPIVPVETTDPDTTLTRTRRIGHAGAAAVSRRAAADQALGQLGRELVSDGRRERIVDVVIIVLGQGHLLQVVAAL